MTVSHMRDRGDYLRLAGSPHRSISIAIVVIAVVMNIATQESKAQEYLHVERVVSDSADEVVASSVSILPDRQRRRPIRALLDRRGPLWSDSEFDIDLRGYDFSRDADDVGQAAAFAVGGELSFRSGRLRNWLSFGASWFTSQPVDAPSDEDGSGLLGPQQTGISVLGKAYVQINEGNLIARLYRQGLDLPYLNRDDSRMIPNTHEAYILGRQDSSERLGFLVGYVGKMKPKSSQDFVSMAQLAGADESDSGTSLVGLRLKRLNGFELSALTLATSDVFSTTYVEANWRQEISADWAVNVAGQYTDQRSIGRDLAGFFSTNALGLRASLSYRNGILTLAQTETATGGAIRSPFGGRPGFNSLMLFNFDRAGERASRIGLPYQFRGSVDSISCR